MRWTLVALVLLTACTSEPSRIIAHWELLEPSVAKTELGGTWSHRAIVIESATDAVAVGDETSSEVHFAIDEEFVVAHEASHEPRIALRIVSHFDVEEHTLASGETIEVANRERPWWQRERIKLYVSEELAGASVRTDAALETIFHVEESPRDDLTHPPARDDEDRLVWTFESRYWVRGSPPGEILVRHELERLEP